MGFNLPDIKFTTGVPLSNQQHYLLSLWCELKRNKGYQPSIREVSRLARVNMNSTKEAFYAIYGKGYLMKGPMKTCRTYSLNCVAVRFCRIETGEVFWGFGASEKEAMRSIVDRQGAL